MPGITAAAAGPLHRPTAWTVVGPTDALCHRDHAAAHAVTMMTPMHGHPLLTGPAKARAVAGAKAGVVAVTGAAARAMAGVVAVTGAAAAAHGGDVAAADVAVAVAAVAGDGIVGDRTTTATGPGRHDHSAETTGITTSDGQQGTSTTTKHNRR